MATLGEYLQTWKLQLSTTKMVSAAFHLNMEAKRGLKVNFNNENLPFCSEPKYLGVGQVALVSLTSWVTSQEDDITRRAPEAAFWLRLGCCSNNVANSRPSAFNRSVLSSCLVSQCSCPPYRHRHQRRLRPTPADNLPILAGIQPAELRRIGTTLSVWLFACTQM